MLSSPFSISQRRKVILSEKSVFAPSVLRAGFELLLTAFTKMSSRTTFLEPTIVTVLPFC